MPEERQGGAREIVVVLAVVLLEVAREGYGPLPAGAEVDAMKEVRPRGACAVARVDGARDPRDAEIRSEEVDPHAGTGSNAMPRPRLR